MKLVNYQLQTQIESLKPNAPTKPVSDYIRSIIEDNSKPYYQRADYLGLTLTELKAKIEFLNQDIKELQLLKKRYTNALDIAKCLTAEIFLENGIDRIDGNIISSLTLSETVTKTKTSLTITDPQAVMRLGYVKFEPDLEAIEEAMTTIEGLAELDKFVSIESTTTTTPAKVKINLKRSSTNTQADELANLVDSQAA